MIDADCALCRGPAGDAELTSLTHPSVPRAEVAAVMDRVRELMAG